MNRLMLKVKCSLLGGMGSSHPKAHAFLSTRYQNPKTIEMNEPRLGGVSSQALATRANKMIMRLMKKSYLTSLISKVTKFQSMS